MASGSPCQCLSPLFTLQVLPQTPPRLLPSQASQGIQASRAPHPACSPVPGAATPPSDPGDCTPAPGGAPPRYREHPHRGTRGEHPCRWESTPTHGPMGCTPTRGPTGSTFALGRGGEEPLSHGEHPHQGTRGSTLSPGGAPLPWGEHPQGTHGKHPTPRGGGGGCPCRQLCHPTAGATGDPQSPKGCPEPPPGTPWPPPPPLSVVLKAAAGAPGAPTRDSSGDPTGTSATPPPVPAPGVSGLNPPVSPTSPRN